VNEKDKADPIFIHGFIEQFYLLVHRRASQLVSFSLRYQSFTLRLQLALVVTNVLT